MTNVVDTLPPEVRTVFVEVLGERDATLLSSLRTQTEPSREERHTVEELLSDEMSKHLGPDYEPTDPGAGDRRRHRSVPRALAHRARVEQFGEEGCRDA